MSRPALAAALFLVAALCPGPSPGVSAQEGPTAAGALLGAAGGTYLALGLTVAAARAGHYVHSPRSLGWQLTPIPAAAAAGAVLGHQGSDELAHAAWYGLLGFASGAVAGSIAGRLLWAESEGVWAGAILGSGLGLLAGSIWGAVEGPDEGAGGSVPVLGISIPVGP